MKKILIIGAYGFLGKNLVNELDKTNYSLFKESRRTGFDLFDLKNVEQKFFNIQPDIIINCAAHVGSMPYVSKYSADVCNDNCLMYLNLYKAVSTVCPNAIIINPISNCSYPGIIDVQHEEMWWDGNIHESVMSYGNPKKMGFVLSECYKKQFGIKTVNLIIPNAYGPNDYLDPERTHAMNGIILRMLRSVKNNETSFQVWGTGTPIREWIFMPDVAKIIKSIIDEERYDIPNPINLGQEFGVSIKDTVNIIKDTIQSNMTIEFDLSKPDGAPKKVLGNKLFSITFPNFSFTSYENGIKETIKFYEELI